MSTPTAAPIAVVGHACLLPGAPDPGRLWDLVVTGRSAIGPVPAARWRLAGAEDPASVQGAPGPRVGGLVDEAVGGDGDDPLLDWVRYVVSGALREAGVDGPQPAGGLVLGTLAYPTDVAQRALERRLTGGGPAVPGFTGRPAAVAARECGLGLGGFALDSACASGLVALKLAADRLRDGSAEVMVAAAVNRADNLLVHNAFHALSALSPTGSSRPMDRSADGLVPAEGAAAVALMRLPDALRRGVPVLGVIRGVGLSNDGRGGGPLAPAGPGQLRAMRAAYAQAGVAPGSVSLLECHATGTPVGDLVEARSAAEFFADAADLPFGSVKSNLGHPLAVGGLAGLVKVLGALRTGVRPPTLGVERPLEALAGSPLRPLLAAEEWRGQRRAAVSAFGFGGANAHVVVDAWDGDASGAVVPPAAPAPRPGAAAELAVVGRGVCRGDVAELEVSGLGVAPRDLERAGAAQVRVLAAAQAASRGLELPRGRTVVVVAGGDDGEVARYGLRWRLPATLGADVPDGVRDRVREACAPPFDLAAVLGTMPNMLAHRVNALGDLGGPGLVVYADGGAGRVALDVARRALRDGSADAAVVADAAGAAVVLRRAADARADGTFLSAVPEDAEPATLAGELTGTAVEVFTGGTREEVLAALAGGRAEPAEAAARGGDRTRLVLAGADREAVRAWLTGGGPRPSGVALREGPPVGGETAFVFTNGSAAYPGMGGELLRAVPGADRAPEPARDVLGQIHAVSALAGAHVRITRDLLGLRPAAALGYSSGEVSAFAALGVWPDPELLVERSRASELFRDGITGAHRVLARAWDAPGRWRALLVPVDAERVRAELEPRVHLMARNAPGVSVIGGDPDAVGRVLARLGTAGVPLDYDIAAHVPELESVREELERVHTLPAVPVPGVRFYRCTDGGSTTGPDAAAAASAVAGQAVGALDWVRTVEKAWSDGVRVFVEHGPQGLCTGWIGRVLAGRPHVAVALDSPVDPLGQLRTAVAELLAAGVPLRTERLFGTAAGGPVARFGLERGPVRLPDLLPAPQRMAPAPPLPRVTRTPAAEAVAEPVPAAVSAGTEPVAVAPVRSGAVHGGLAAAVVAHRALVAAVHTDFVRVQAEAHARFLAGRAAAVPALLAAASAARPLPAVAPVAAAPTAVAPAPPGAVPGVPPGRDGVVWGRAELERLASGRVSELFGPAFRALDGRTRQTRMPRGPLLLADRVTLLEGEPGSMGRGVIHTETDVAADAWYLDAAGRMAAGPFVEAGQADLLLISWLGVDLDNPDDRVYRLLGCRLVFHGPLPLPGERLRYEISIDRYVAHDGVRLFFFRYACYSGERLCLTLSEGQAGHFTDAELAASGGVAWTPAAQPPPGRAEPPVVAGTRDRFGPRELRAFAEGRPADCFGPGWEATAGHRATPRPPSGGLGLLHEVTAFDPAGGPWGRGFLSAVTDVRPDDWFFPSHFLNDPCMPGTLMFEAGLQALAFHLAALGHTVDRDGWRFEPLEGEPYDLCCRGQVTPATRRLEYRVHVREVTGGAEPTIRADLLCLADGLPAFHVPGAGVRLVPPQGARREPTR